MADAVEQLVLVLAARPVDRQALVATVRRFHEPCAGTTQERLIDDLNEGAAVLILSEDCAVAPLMNALARRAKKQPEWNALPVLALVRHPSDPPPPLRALLPARNERGLHITLLPRPVPPDVLRGAVFAGLQDRQRQYRIRDQISDLEESKRHIELLAREVQHRAKNNLSRLHAIMHQTWRNAKEPAKFIEGFEARLMAMARSQDLLNEKQWQKTILSDLISSEVEAMGKAPKDRLVCHGDRLELNPNASMALHLVFHELMTNAIKYGALSADGGNVLVRWDEQDHEDEGRRLIINWIEQDGPSIEHPSHKGFGSQLIQLVLKRELGGQAMLDYAETGLNATFSIPLNALLPSEENDAP